MTEGKIVFIHSLNNYTGSPNVLSQVIKGLIERGYEAELITSRGQGFLSDIPSLQYRYTCYRWLNNKILTLLLLLISQLGLFFRIMFSSRRYIYYINTVTPFGAIMACWLTGKKSVIHIHENMCQKKPMYVVYRNIYRFCNKKSIFVSKYLESTALNCRDGVVIHNSLPATVYSAASEHKKSNTYTLGSNVLMVASLRRFKGIYEFAELAKRMPEYRFELVLSAGEEDVERFRESTGKIPNLDIYPLQTDLHPFYSRAKILLQLSHPESWVETFGLTILESMVYGVPAIVPNVGGPLELIEDGVNGYTTDPHNLDYIQSRISGLMTDPELYRRLSEAAREKACLFEESLMMDRIESYII